MLQNQKGSALIETLILWLYIIPFIGALLICLGWIGINHATDQILEDHLMCKVSEKTKCRLFTLQKLKLIQLHILRFQDSASGSKYSVSLKAEFTPYITFYKERQLMYEKAIY